MRKVMKYPIYPIAFSYVSGIFFGLNFKGLSDVVFCVLAVCLVLLGLLCLRMKHKPFENNKNLCFLLCLCFAFSSLGYWVFTFHNRPVKIMNPDQQVFTVRVDEVLKSSERFHRFYGTVSAHPKPVKILGYSSKTRKMPEAGMVCRMVGRIAEIPAPKNPAGFDYKKYLSRKRIYYQVNAEYLTSETGMQNSLYKRITGIRDTLVNRFSDLGYDSKVSGFAEALLFGIKTHLDEGLQLQFKNLGILHVLAVSGMHVVLLFGTISYILRQFRVPRKIIISILILFLLVFSIMAGLSGSVLRAVLMCLMVLLGNYLRARSETRNLLAGSMFLILLFDPNYLLDVGFQLSYLAVFSIIYCYPAIRPYFTFKNPFLNYFSQLVGISLVAQLGVLPVSIFYFKQIPLLFLLGNIIAIPITSFLLIAWVLQLALSFLSIDAAACFTVVLNKTALFSFGSLEAVSEYFAVRTISVHLEFIQSLALSAAFFCVFWFFYRKRMYKIYLFLAFILVFQSDMVQKTFQHKSSKEFLLMHDAENLVFLNRNGRSVRQWGEGTSFVSQSIKHYVLQYGASLEKKDCMAGAFKVGNEHWLVVDSLGVFPDRRFDRVVIAHNAKVNMERLVRKVRPKMVIVHSSNRSYLADAYTDYLTEEKIPYYDMRTRGAFILSYN